MFMWFGTKLKLSHKNPLKNKLICHSRRWRDFTNDVKISRYAIS